MEIDKGQNMNVLLHQDTTAPLKLASDVAQWPLAGLQQKNSPVAKKRFSYRPLWKRRL